MFFVENYYNELNTEFECEDFEVCACCGKVDFDAKSINKYRDMCEEKSNLKIEYICSECINAMPSYLSIHKTRNKRNISIVETTPFSD